VQIHKGHAFDYLRNIQNNVARYFTAESGYFPMLTQHGQLPGQLLQLLGQLAQLPQVLSQLPGSF
jgi:hypothetical protein